MYRSSAKRLLAFIVSVSAAFVLVPSVALFGASKVEDKAASKIVPKVLFPARQATSRPIRENLQRPVRGTDRKEMLFFPPHITNPHAAYKPDPLVHRTTASPSMPDPLLSFEGVGDVNGVQPADTTMAVGPNHVVQWVNLAFQVFDRDGNDLSGGPVNGNVLWADLGGDCANVNGGDIIVKYDHLADRWFFAQLAAAVQGANGNHECMAMSVTNDPLGSFYLYDFLYSQNDLNDYPKFGVWPDAYYMTARNFANSASFSGMTVTAFDRAALLAGAPALSAIQVNVGDIAPNLDGLLPGDISGGATGPSRPQGSVTPPEIIAGVGSPDYDGSPSAVVHLFQFHPNFADPPSSTFTGPVDLDVADFGIANLPTEPDGSQMESLPFPMYRLDYRNFGDHDAIVFNHTVDAGPNQVGVRWYEIRDPLGSPALYQQGTYAPDTSNRWFASAAVDVSGNIALGYSVADADIFPSVRYAGRLAGDPLGDLTQGENEIIAGNGNFDGGRWGDYSTILVDPTDQCTFWYTTMYVAGTGSADWATRIGSFKFPSCTAGPSGTISGTVTDGTNPLAGARVVAGAGGATTDASGNYLITLPVGTYAMTASKYGYFPSSVSGIVVSEDANTVQNFVLAVAPSVVVNGVVRDGSGGGWPLYAQVKISAPGAPTFNLWTDPVTGYYSQTLVTGTTYNFAVTAVSPGYNPGGGPVPLGVVAPQSAGGVVKNWTLTVNAVICTAPGYTPNVTGVFEDFSSGSLPPGWSVVNNSQDGGGPWVIQDGGDPCGDFPGNLTGGSGPYAVINSDCDGFVTDDSELWTASADMTGLTNPEVRFKLDELNCCGQVIDVDYSLNGGDTWTNVWEKTTTERGPAQEDIALPAAVGQSDVKVRFRFNAFFGWWWQVDDVLLGEAGCLPRAGGMVVGNVRDANTGLGLNGATVTNLPADGSTTTFATPQDPNQDDGLYLLFAENGSQPFEASKNQYTSQQKTIMVVPNAAQRLDFSLASGHLTADPTRLSARVDPAGTANTTLTLNNTGTGAANFELREINAPAPSGPVHHGPYVSPDLLKQLHDRIPKGLVNARTSQGIPALPARDLHPRRPTTAGDALFSFPTTLTLGWGIAYDTNSDDMWISNLGVGGGDDLEHEYLSDGTKTGATIDDSGWIGAWDADGAYNPTTGMLWRVNVGGDNCIYEIDPAAKVATGNKICGSPWDGISQRGLAYNRADDTYFIGGWNEGVIYHIDHTGAVLDSSFVALSISGLAYTNGHVLVMQSGQSPDVVVLDPNDGYSVVTSFNISENGSPIGIAGAGMEIDCDGNLWLIDQATQIVYKAESGEAPSPLGTCGAFTDKIPWLTEDPTEGAVSAGGAAATNPAVIDITFDAGRFLPGLRQGQLAIKTDTPYQVPNVPVDFTIRFLDVADSSIFQAFIYGAAGAGVMQGGPPSCVAGILYFCPTGVVTRADMAGYIFRAVHGAGTPPPVYLNTFDDVHFNDYNSFYIQGIFDDGITAGCGNNNYCPNDPNTRAQMSVFIWKGQHGSTPPPACTGVFADVPCPGGFAVDFIEGIAGEGVTVGCGGGYFCPNANITNAQMAVFLVKGFNIPYLP